MARLAEDYSLLAYRFHARFWNNLQGSGEPLDVDGRGFTSMEVGAKHSGMRYTPGGLEVWTAHRLGRPLLFDLIKGARLIEVVIYANRGLRKDEKVDARVFSIAVSNPVCLPFRLDAVCSMAALDGVLFQTAEVLGMSDEKVMWPPVEEAGPEKPVDGDSPAVEEKP